MFWKIVEANYSETEVGMYTWWADELMQNLDKESVQKLVDNDKHSVRAEIYDQDLDFDFPDPPEFSI